MTYKNAVAGLHLGGGKSIIIGDNKTRDREKIFRAHGRFIESLGGRYITAEDVGTSTKDMDYVHMETGHVAGLAGKSGDPSPVTAHGVFRAVQASANRKWGSDSLEGKTVTIMGCGSVGTYLAKELHEAGARLIVSDIDAAKAAKVSKMTGAKVVGRCDLLCRGRHFLAMRAGWNHQRHHDSQAQGADRRGWCEQSAPRGATR
jgi:leucine dehydrogenase